MQLRNLFAKPKLFLREDRKIESRPLKSFLVSIGTRNHSNFKQSLISVTLKIYVSYTPFSHKSIYFITSFCKEINVVKTAFNIFAMDLDKGFSLMKMSISLKEFPKIPNCLIFFFFQLILIQPQVWNDTMNTLPLKPFNHLFSLLIY